MSHEVFGGAGQILNMMGNVPFDSRWPSGLDETVSLCSILPADGECFFCLDREFEQSHGFFQEKIGIVEGFVTDVLPADQAVTVD